MLGWPSLTTKIALLVGVAAIVSVGLLFVSWKARGQEIDALNEQLASIERAVKVLEKQSVIERNIDNASRDRIKRVISAPDGDATVPAPIRAAVDSLH